MQTCREGSVLFNDEADGGYVVTGCKLADTRRLLDDDDNDEPRSYTQFPFLSWIIFGRRVTYVTRRTYDEFPFWMRRIADALMTPEKNS